MLAALSSVEPYKNIPAQILDREIGISSMIKVPDSIPGSYRLFMQSSAGLIGSDLELLSAALGDNSVEFTSKKPPSPDFISRHIWIMWLLWCSSPTLQLAIRKSGVGLWSVFGVTCSSWVPNPLNHADGVLGCVWEHLSSTWMGNNLLLEISAKSV